MRLTLDWDDGDAREDHLSDVRGRPNLGGDNPWQMRQSSGGTGFHYIEWDAATDWNDVVDLRETYGDDPKRLRLDQLRQRAGSPFLQVLYDVKYMDRWGWDPDSGNQSEVLDGTQFVADDNRIKQGGRLQYGKIAARLAADVYGSQTALAENFGWGRSTVSGWVNGHHGVSDGAKKKLKRAARHHGLGHYVAGADKAAQEMGLDVEYVDPASKERRRTIVEYADAPWDFDIGGDNREYALVNVHTGTYNDNHEEGQLKFIHDQVMDHALDCLSPSNPETGVKLDLDRETVHPVEREQDSINWENALLDPDEARYNQANMVGKTGATSQGIHVDDVAVNPLYEVILWDEDMTSTLWHVIGVWDGGSVRGSTVVYEDVAGGGAWW